MMDDCEKTGFETERKESVGLGKFGVGEEWLMAFWGTKEGIYMQ